jgi:hypothetical protein
MTDPLTCAQRHRRRSRTQRIFPDNLFAPSPAMDCHPLDDQKRPAWPGLFVREGKGGSDSFPEKNSEARKPGTEIPGSRLLGF